MTPTHRALSCWLLFSLAVLARAAGPHGTDVGWTVDHTTGHINFTSTMANQLSQGEVGWVRVEMALVKGHTNWDATMLGYYDIVVNNAHNAGLQVLMLIDGGSWPGSQSDWCANNSENNPGFNGDNAYVENYATNAVVPLVQHFHDRVKLFELWNEPNCWTVNPSSGVYTGATFVYPSNFGWLLTRSWEAVHQTYHLNDVTLFSGGLFGLSAFGTSYSSAGGQYLDDTYNTGTNLVKGGSFAHTKSAYNAYPLDGIGQHVYITQGGVVSSNTFRQYEDWVHQALTKYEGTSSPKKTFITEFGWQTTNNINSNGVSTVVQDTNLVTAFNAIRATPYVQTVIWFSWQDNTAGALWYGVLDAAGNAKLSYPDFQHAERYEGMLANSSSTNAGIQAYYSRLGQSILGSPYDNGRGVWVTNFLNGYAQDYYGGSHVRLTLLSSTNGTFELNDLYGFWGYFTTNNGATNFGPPIDNAFVSGGGIRQDFTLGYLSWDSVNQVVWHVVNNLPPAPSSVAAVPGNAQIALQWNAVPTATSYKVYTAINTNGAYALNTTVVGPPNYTDAPLGNGTTYYYEISAVNSYGEGPVSAPVNATPQSVTGNLPSPWLDGDIGSVNLSGGAGYTASGGKFSVYNSGADIAGSADAFHFVYQPFNGDGTIIARIKSQSTTNALAKAGVMIRESLATNAVYVATVLTPSNGVRMDFRAAAGGVSTDLAGPAALAPYWLKLTRSGSNFTAAVSGDGISYVQVQSTNLAMGTNVFIGLAGCSHNTNVLSTAVFDNVSVTPQVAPAWLTANPGNAQVSLVWPATLGAAAYDVKRSTVSGGPYAVVAGGVSATNYQDNTAVNGTTFYYVVAATNNAGEGPASVEAGALPVAPPQITAAPLPQTVNQGDNVQFGATASSLVPMTCQWQLNGAAIAGAQATNYAIANVQPGNIGNYAAVFSNYAGSTTSAPALLMVRPWLVFDRNGVLSWSGAYTLQRATNVSGPYENLTGIVSPYTNSLTAWPQQFFRLQY
ncbi:MAG: hypothetical protein P4N60_12580 [Verrucomicrobiae bacterium]|nr:hypothetical protein [Verrucomicrobiae bacterium]